MMRWSRRIAEAKTAPSIAHLPSFSWFFCGAELEKQEEREIGCCYMKRGIVKYKMSKEEGKKRIKTDGRLRVCGSAGDEMAKVREAYVCVWRVCASMRVHAAFGYSCLDHP